MAVQDKNIADMQANMDQWAAESATLLANTLKHSKQRMLSSLMDWATHYCDLLRQACLEDFGQVPLYLVDKHDVPERFSLEGCGGCTSPAMDLDLQPMLESAGLWRGRGYLMAVDVAAHPTTEYAHGHRHS